MITIDFNHFSHQVMKNYVSVPGTQGRTFNSSLKFYYLDKQGETSGYELYKGGGYLGFTPSSWSDEMGIFHMFKTMGQGESENALDLYSIQHVIGLEIHQSSRTSLNYISIGGFNESIVENPKEIVWAHSYCSEHWEIYVNSL